MKKTKWTRKYYNRTVKKGGVVIIVAVKDYIKEAEPQVNNIDSYKKLKGDQAATNMKLVNDTLERLNIKN